MNNEPEMILSLRTFVDEETGLYGVEMYVSGLKDQQHADAAVSYLSKMLCGGEVTRQ